MTEEIKLEAKNREEKNGTVQTIRKDGFIPANIYGPGFDNKNIMVKEQEFNKVFGVAGESQLINLEIEGGQQEKVIVKDIQKNPVKDNIIHVDFYKVDMNKKIQTEIPLVFIGEAKAVKELGGILIKNIDSLEVKCLPGNLVDNIEVDLSVLVSIHDAIRIEDLKLPEGMEPTGNVRETLVNIVEPVKEEEKKEVAAVEGGVVEGGEGEEKKEGGEDEEKKEEPKK